jgi:hypothetical protein
MNADLADGRGSERKRKQEGTEATEEGNKELGLIALLCFLCSLLSFPDLRKSL